MNISIRNRMLVLFASALPALAMTASSSEAQAVTVTEMVPIYKGDPREIKNLTLTVYYEVNGEPYVDSEYIGTWTNCRHVLGLRQTTKTWDGSAWVGNFLYKTGTSQCGTAYPAPGLIIGKEDSRAMTNLSFEVSFQINGQWHYDWEDTYWRPDDKSFLAVNANWDGHTTWDGEKWVGNLLYSTWSLLVHPVP